MDYKAWRKKGVKEKGLHIDKQLFVKNQEVFTGTEGTEL